MAKMIPPVINPDTQSSAERKIFERLRDELSFEWTVLHSLNLANVRGKAWGELDFVLLGPPGIFCLEIKGGRIRHENGFWVFTDRYGNENRKHESPFEQAKTAHYALLNYVQGQFVREFIPLFGFGVVTPDIDFRVNRPDVVKEVLYDKSNANETMSEYTDRLSKYWRSKLPNKPLVTPNTTSKILDRLRGDLDLIPSLSMTIMDVNRELIHLTEGQEQIIKGLEAAPRALVRGNAGTGKTLCAVAEAERLATQGKKVLLTCYNRRLAVHLRKVVSHENIDTINIHALMARLIRNGGLKFPNNPTSIDFVTSIPETAFEAIVESGASESYDVIIADEAQDLIHKAYLDLVFDPLLKSGLKLGEWRFFVDEQQSIFGEINEDAMAFVNSCGPAPYRLTLNCRNTKQIATHAGLISGTKDDQVCKAEGPETTTTWCRDDAHARRSISRTVMKLISQGLRPDQVVILSPNSLDTSVLSEGLENSPYRLVSPNPDSGPTESEIGFYTIQSFKGLESDAVILADLKDFSTLVGKGHNYVGATRAKTMLFVFPRESEKTQYNELVRQWVRSLDSTA